MTKAEPDVSLTRHKKQQISLHYYYVISCMCFVHLFCCNTVAYFHDLFSPPTSHLSPILSYLSSNSTEKNMDVAISVPLQPMQLLSWGHGPSLWSAPSTSAVKVSGTRFLLTLETFILLRLFAKLYGLICFWRSSRHCNALSVSLL